MCFVIFEGAAKIGGGINTRRTKRSPHIHSFTVKRDRVHTREGKRRHWGMKGGKGHTGRRWENPGETQDRHTDGAGLSPALLFLFLLCF